VGDTVPRTLLIPTLYGHKKNGIGNASKFARKAENSILNGTRSAKAQLRGKYIITTLFGNHIIIILFKP
jgi:hypothetical protein